MQAIAAAVRRAAVALGFTAGVLSFVYGLKAQDRFQWILIAVGVAAIAAFGLPLAKVIYQVAQRYADYPKVRESLALATIERQQLRDQVARLVADLDDRLETGVAEGMARCAGALLAAGCPVTAKTYELVEGEVVVWASLDDPAQQDVRGARYVLEHVHSGRLITVLAAEAPSMGMTCLTPVRETLTEAWQAETRSVLSGTHVPADFVLRACSPDDYSRLEK